MRKSFRTVRFFFSLLLGRRPKVFWWSMVQRQNFARENFGDVITPYLVARLTGKKPVLLSPNRSMARFFTHSIMTGSIISQSWPDTLVWGSGIISREEKIKGGKFLAVRGPETAKRLAALGFNPPSVYGDPAILLPVVYDKPVPPEYRVGVVAHYVDHQALAGIVDSPDVLLIDLLTDNIEHVIDAIRSCERILSSSLHGLIVAHTYGIPAAWWKFSDRLSGDDVKFDDYYASVGLATPVPGRWTDVSEASAEAVFTLPETNVLEKLRRGLLDTYPYPFAAKG